MILDGDVSLLNGVSTL